MSVEVMTIGGIACYEELGNAFLNLEQVARGLGFTTIAASGNEVVRWNTVYSYLRDLGAVAESCNGDYRAHCPEFIPEHIFYRLAMKANNEAAKKFQEYVAKDVLPSVRKTGVYIAPTVDSEMMFKIAEAMREKERQIVFLESEAAKNKPLVAFAEKVSMASNSISVGDFAKLLCDEQIPIGRNRLFQWFKDNGYLQSDNIPYQRYIDAGYFEVIEQPYNTPYKQMVSVKTLITGKGQIYFTEKMRKVG